LSRRVGEWQSQLLRLAAEVEAALDFADEGDVGEDLPHDWPTRREQLAAAIGATLRSPPAERLRDGVRVVIAGPPNAGKSSLLNWLAGRRAAITSAIAGTTRDRVEAPTAIGGQPFLLIDTAGLREGQDEIEAEGIQLAHASLAAADLILWLGPPADCPDPGRAIIIESKIDLTGGPLEARAEVGVSCETGEGMDRLVALLIERARSLLPQEGEVAINGRHRAALWEALQHLEDAGGADDLIVVSEALRLARVELDRVTGRAGVEDMLDALFGSFCIGK
jgi:tRNA modification GTPase